MKPTEHDVDALARSLYAHWTLGEARVIARRVLASDWFTADRERYAQQRAAEVWDEGRSHGAKDMQAYYGGGSWDDDVRGCGPDSWDCDCPNPYRTEVTP